MRPSQSAFNISTDARRPVSSTGRLESPPFRAVSDPGAVSPIVGWVH